MVVILLSSARLHHALSVSSSRQQQNTPHRHGEFIYISMTSRAQDKSPFPQNWRFIYISQTSFFVFQKPWGIIRSGLFLVLIVLSSLHPVSAFVLNYLLFPARFSGFVSSSSVLSCSSLVSRVFFPLPTQSPVRSFSCHLFVVRLYYNLLQLSPLLKSFVLKNNNPYFACSRVLFTFVCSRVLSCPTSAFYSSHMSFFVPLRYGEPHSQDLPASPARPPASGHLTFTPWY